jgi:Flp pilus assembly protein TadD
MMAREAVLCPACGTRNRPDWNYCARCEELLEGALPAEATAETTVVPEEMEPLEGSTLASSSILILAVLAFGALGFSAYRHVSTTPPPEGPDPGMFTIGTQPTEVPKAPPAGGPGVNDYDSGRRLLSAGDTAGAVSQLRAAVAADPDNARYRSYLAHALWQAGSRDEALTEHAAAARLDQRLQMQYARALDLAGRTEEATIEYQAVLARNPEAATVREDLGRLLFRSGDYAAAAPHLEKAVEARANDPVLRQEMAYALDQSGEKPRAESAYRQVLESEPRAVITRGLLAENLYEQGKKEEAMSVLERGLEVTPDAPLLQRQLGSLLEREGKRAEAAAAYRSYARLAPNAPDASAIAERADLLETTGGNP